MNIRLQLCSRALRSLLLVFALVASAVERAPNIIHIIGDDVGYDDLGCFGAKDIKTPNLDKLAARRMKFTSFYAPSPVCTASRAAILTGCYAQRVSLPSVLFPYSRVGLHSNEVTIAELLKSRGFHYKSQAGLEASAPSGHFAAVTPRRVA